MSDEKLNKKTRKLGKKTNDESNISNNRRQISVTSFDLLNGEYANTERNRKIFSIIIVIGLLTFAFLGYQGVNITLTKNSQTAKKLLLDEELRKVESRFTQTTGIPEGITQKDLIADFDNYEKDLEFISYNTAIPFEVLTQLRSNEVYITSVNTRIVYSNPAESEEKAKLVNPNDVPLELLKDIDIEAIKKEEGVPIYYRITATSSSALLLAEWAKRVRDANIFNEMLIVSSGNIYTLHGISTQKTPPPTIANSWNQASLPVKKEKQESGVINEED
jgi:hypothetical protein